MDEERRMLLRRTAVVLYVACLLAWSDGVESRALLGTRKTGIG